MLRIDFQISFNSNEMIEVVALFFLCRRNGNLAKQKGLPPRVWWLNTIAAWVIAENYYRVQFILNEQTLTAFYREDGKLLAVTRNIRSLQLPIILQTELKKKYSNYWITELFEKSNDEGAEYYITIEDADNKTILKSFAGSSSWVVYQKSRKS